MLAWSLLFCPHNHEEIRLQDGTAEDAINLHARGLEPSCPMVARRTYAVGEVVMICFGIQYENSFVS